MDIFGFCGDEVRWRHRNMSGEQFIKGGSGDPG